MKNKYYLIIPFLLTLLFLSCSPVSKIGKLYTTAEAEKLFGKVIFTVEIDRNQLDNLLNRTNKTIMFGLINRQLIILDNNRKLIYPGKADYKDSDVFTVYSVDMIRELLSNNRMEKQGDSESENISVEQRHEVLSISINEKTLETGVKCPPMCPN